MKKLIMGAVLAALCTTPALAQQTNAGQKWEITITSGGNGRSMSENYIMTGSPNACPHGLVKLEPRPRNAGVKEGVAKPMTREQIVRGDKRWHVVCDWVAYAKKQAAARN